VGEETERYVVEIRSGGTVLRRWETGEPTAIYDLDAQIEDFGGAATVLDVGIAQISSRYGAGRRRDSILWV